MGLGKRCPLVSAVSNLRTDNAWAIAQRSATESRQAQLRRDSHGRCIRPPQRCPLVGLRGTRVHSIAPADKRQKRRSSCSTAFGSRYEFLAPFPEAHGALKRLVSTCRGWWSRQRCNRTVSECGAARVALLARLGLRPRRHPGAFSGAACWHISSRCAVRRM